MKIDKLDWFITLSEREVQVVKHVAAGETNAEIARLMHIQTSTVEWYLRGLFVGIGVPRRGKLAAWYWENRVAIGLFGGPVPITPHAGDCACVACNGALA